jgi:cytoskeletal protein CcmA (bactofilin family)
MFSKNKSETIETADGKPVKPAVPSIVSEDLTIKGDLISEGEIQIDGRVEGDINTATLLVGETAEITGEIKAKRVRVYGRVNGQITAQSVTLASTAHITGDVIHEDLAIEKGAFLEGHCQRIADKRVESIVRGTDNAVADGSSSSNVREVTPPVPAKPHQSMQKDSAPGLKKPTNGSDKAASA